MNDTQTPAGKAEKDAYLRDLEERLAARIEEVRAKGRAIDEAQAILDEGLTLLREIKGAVPSGDPSPMARNSYTDQFQQGSGVFPSFGHVFQVTPDPIPPELLSREPWSTAHSDRTGTDIDYGSTFRPQTAYVSATQTPAQLRKAKVLQLLLSADMDVGDNRLSDPEALADEILSAVSGTEEAYRLTGDLCTEVAYAFYFNKGVLRTHAIGCMKRLRAALRGEAGAAQS